MHDKKFYNLGTGLASQSDMFLAEPNKLDIKIHLHGFLFIMNNYHQILRHKERQTNQNQTQFCSNLLTSRMLYDVSRWGSQSNVVITANVSISTILRIGDQVLTFGVFWPKHLQEVRSTVYRRVQSI